MKRLIILTAVIGISISAAAQKKPLDHSVYDSWQSISGETISHDGKVVTYMVNPQEGDGTLYIRTFGKKGRETAVERGYRASVTEDGAYVICLVKPLFADTRQAKIDKKKKEDMPADSIAIVNVATGEIVRFPKVNTFAIGKHASEVIAFDTRDTSAVAKADRKSKELGTSLIIYNLRTAVTDTIPHIGSFGFDEGGRHLAMVKNTDKEHCVAGFYETSTRESRFLEDTLAYLSRPVFDRAGTRALYYAAKEKSKTGSTVCEMHLYTLAGGSDEVLGTSGIPEGSGFTEQSKCHFSHDGTRIYAGFQEIRPEKDTTIVEFEYPQLDIWNWDAGKLPPMGKKDLQRDLERTSTAVYRNGRFIPLGETEYSRVMHCNRYDSDIFLLGTVIDPVTMQWEDSPAVRLTLVNIASGSKDIAEGHFSRVSLSPLGGYAIWWDLEHSKWMKYDVASGVTGPLVSPDTDPGTWMNDEDDHPSLKPCHGMAFDMLEDDSAVLLYDKYDIWKVSLKDGRAERLTRGREGNKTYRYESTLERMEDLGIPAGGEIVLNVFDNVTKENGIATLSLANPAKTFAVKEYGAWTFPTIEKAHDSQAFIFRKGNTVTPPDIYYSEALGKKDLKLSSINPQQAEYNWCTAELYHWKAFDGTELDGIIYKPEDFDPAKKYPVMIYFYEKSSETLNDYYAPTPSASTVNRVFYASRGYIVFIPDIVYTPGLPGESAYNCIVSGAESLKQFPWVDAERMAIQGQSWGGYQVAYLVTRTGMFRAAGAGAPVSNMTSAYGGIRWQTGSSRQHQYEKGQSRIGRNLWDGLPLYMENSPLFRLPEVTTPLLIMHNDNDGAVPWYQGIEMFMGLRRLGKPCWLLEYNGEEHNLRERRNRKDLSVRLQQFFDYYLKDAPAPAWMTSGVPTTVKDRYLGYETE